MSSEYPKLRSAHGALAALLLAAVSVPAWGQSEPGRLIVMGPAGTRELRAVQDPCEDAAAIRNQVEAFQAAFAPNTTDLDADGLPEVASVRLLNEAACRDDNPSLQTATVEAYNANLEILDTEAEASAIGELREGLAALLAVGASAQEAVFDALADGGVVLKGAYFAVTCSATTECIAENPLIRAADEPFTGPGDIDGDGVSNAQEFNNVVVVGGTLGVFIVVAFDSTEDGTNLILVEDDGATCGFVTLLQGTPLAHRLVTIRAWRDAHLLTHPVGLMAADVYYRVSPPFVAALEARPQLLRTLRAGINRLSSHPERNTQ